MQFPQWSQFQRCPFYFPQGKHHWSGASLLASLFVIGIMQPALAQPSSTLSDVNSKRIAPIPVAMETETPPPPPLNPLQLSPILFNAPPPPTEQGAPRGRRTGGASRGNCLNYEGLTALVPVADHRPVTDGDPVANHTSESNEGAGEVAWGQTTAAKPTLWFYSPAGLMPHLPVELVVQDAMDQYISITTLEVEAATGIIAIQIVPSAGADADTTDSIATLPIDVLLPWTFSIYCDSDRSNAFVSVKGTIQRVNVDELAPFSGDVDVSERERSLSQARAYADAGVWHDALTIVATLRHADPSDSEIAQMWTTLLQQIGLESLSIEPIQDCCTAAQ